MLGFVVSHVGWRDVKLTLAEVPLVLIGVV
jgi:hypothetical protein